MRRDISQSEKERHTSRASLPWGIPRTQNTDDKNGCGDKERTEECQTEPVGWEEIRQRPRLHRCIATDTGYRVGGPGGEGQAWGG